MTTFISGIYSPQKSVFKQQTYLRQIIITLGMIICSVYSSLSYAVTANPDSAITTVNSSVNISVLNNDILESGSSAAQDPNSAVCLNPQQFSSACTSNELSFNATSPENGTLTLNGTTVIYTPDENFIGNDSFIYTVYHPGTESDPEQDETSVSITVREEVVSAEEQNLIDAITSLCSGASEGESEAAYSTATTSEDVSTNCAAFNNLSSAAQADALVTLAADQVTAGYSSTINMTRDQRANISSRLTQLRNNSSGLSLRGLTITNYGEKLDGDWLQAAYTSLADSGGFEDTPASGGAASSETGRSTYTPFGYFINGSITLGDKDSSASERGYDLDSDNYTLGMDYRFSDQLVVGAAYGYSSSNIEFNSTGDDMDNQVNNLFLYGSLYDNNFFFSSTIGYAFGEIDTSRRILIPGTLDTQAKGTTDTSQFILQLNGSYDMNHGALSFGPYAKLDITEGEIQSYAETNGGGFEVAFDDQDISSQLLTIGGQAQYALSYSWGVLLPSARVELKNEFNDSQDAISGRFLFDAANTKFSITADEIDSLWYIFGTGLSAVFPYGLSAYVDYETTASLNNIELHTYSFGGRWELTF